MTGPSGMKPGHRPRACTDDVADGSPTPERVPKEETVGTSVDGGVVRNVKNGVLGKNSIHPGSTHDDGGSPSGTASLEPDQRVKGEWGSSDSDDPGTITIQLDVSPFTPMKTPPRTEETDPPPIDEADGGSTSPRDSKTDESMTTPVVSTPASSAVAEDARSKPARKSRLSQAGSRPSLLGRAPREPPRLPEVTHGDVLMKEMRWMQGCFVSELRARLKLCRTIAAAAVKYLGGKEHRLSRQREEEEKRLRGTARTAALAIRQFWKVIESIVSQRIQVKLRDELRVEKEIKQDELVAEASKFARSISQGLRAWDTGVDPYIIRTAQTPRFRLPPAVGPAAAEPAPIAYEKKEEEEEEEEDEEVEPELWEEQEREDIALDEALSESPRSSEGEEAEPLTELELLKAEAEMDLNALAKTFYVEEAWGVSLPVKPKKEEEEGEPGPPVTRRRTRASVRGAREEERIPKKPRLDPPTENDTSIRDAGIREEKKQEDPDPKPTAADWKTLGRVEGRKAGVKRRRLSSAAARRAAAQRLVKPPEEKEEEETENVLDVCPGKCPVPFLLRATLRAYQHEGLTWLLTLHDNKASGILADEMGLGKTIQTIALLAYLACYRGIWGPHLIVVPSSVLLNWEMEFHRFLPGFNVLTYYGGRRERERKRHGWTEPFAFNVCVVSYALVVADAHLFKRKPWYYMVLDEAQNIKNYQSQKWQTLLNFNSQRRLLLTGTPIQNDLTELWALMHFLMPNVFESHADWKEMFSDPLTRAIEAASIEKEQALVANLHDILRPFLLRRLKREVEAQMPSKYEHVLKCNLTRRQRLLYDELMESKSVKSTLESADYFGLLNVLMQLRKVCNHPNLLFPREPSTPFGAAALIRPVLEIPRFLDLSLHASWTRTPEDHLRQLRWDHWLTSVATAELHSLGLPTQEEDDRQQRPSTTVSHPWRELARFPIAMVTESPKGSGVGTFFANETLPPWLGTCPPPNQDVHPTCVRCRTLQTLLQEPLPEKAEGTPPKLILPAAMKQQAMSAGVPRLSQAVSQAFSVAEDVAMPARSVCYHGSSAPADQADVLSLPQHAAYPSLSLAGSVPLLDLVNVHLDPRPRPYPTSPRRSWLGRCRTVLRGPSKGTSEDIAGSDAVLLRRVLFARAAAAHADPRVQVSPDGTLAAQYAHVAATAMSTMRRSANLDYMLSHPVADDDPYMRTFGRQRRPEPPFPARQYAQSTPRSCFWGQRFRDKVRRAILGSHPAYRKVATPSHPSWLDPSDDDDPKSSPRVFLFPCDPLVILDRFYEPRLLSHVICIRTSPVTQLGPRLVYRHPMGEYPELQTATRGALLDAYYPLRAAAAEFHRVDIAQRCLMPPKSILQDDCGKLQLLSRLLHKLRTDGHRCILFTQMSRMLDVLEGFLNFHGFTYVRLDGGTKVEIRQRLVDRFNDDPRIFIFMASTRVGGVGLNLMGADTVIFYDTDWNPAMDRQAMDRCHRIGQTREVHVYRLITEATIEENILRKQLLKRMLDDIVVDQGQFTTQRISDFLDTSDVKEMLTTRIDATDLYVTRVLHESKAPTAYTRAAAAAEPTTLFEQAIAKIEDADDHLVPLPEEEEPSLGGEAVELESEFVAKEQEQQQGPEMAGARGGPSVLPPFPEIAPLEVGESEAPSPLPEDVELPFWVKRRGRARTPLTVDPSTTLFVARVVNHAVQFLEEHVPEGVQADMFKLQQRVAFYRAASKERSTERTDVTIPKEEDEQPGSPPRPPAAAVAAAAAPLAPAAPLPPIAEEKPPKQRRLSPRGGSSRHRALSRTPPPARARRSGRRPIHRDRFPSSSSASSVVGSEHEDMESG